MNTAKPTPKPLVDIDESLVFQKHPDFVDKSIAEKKSEVPEKSEDALIALGNGKLEMEFSRMKGFPNHQFQLYKGKKFDEMVESIKHCGILMPIILWRKENGVYVILSGHNRVEAAKSVGLKKGPVVIEENLTEEDAMLYVIETNRIQRGFSELSHHDRGLCLKNHYETTKSQGKRTDLIKKIETLLNPHNDEAEGTSSQVATKSRTDEKIGDENGLSKDTVARYIRLATHWLALLSYVDVGNIPFMAAYNLSFIEDKDKQKFITDIIKRDNCNALISA
jgi:ParB family chromosome partitioning protein